MSNLQHDRERDQAIDTYLQALDQGDLETVATILDQAATDPTLDSLIHEVHRALYAEEGFDAFAADSEQVRILAHQHLHSAFTDEAAIEFEVERPLTVGEVVARLQADRQIATEEHEISNRLLESRVELPEEMTTHTISELARRIGVVASERFWSVFRDTAIMLGLGRSQAQAHMAAARAQRLRYRTDQRVDPAQQEDKQKDKAQ